MQNFWEKKKGHIFLIFVIFHIRKAPSYLKHCCEAVPHHISILFVLDNAEGIETYCHY